MSDREHRAIGSMQDGARAVAFGFVAAAGLVHALLYARRPGRSVSDGAAVGLVAWIAALIASGSLDRFDLDGVDPAFVVVPLAFVGLDIITTLVREMREDTLIWPLVLAAVVVASAALTSRDPGLVEMSMASTALVSIPLGWRIKRVARREEDADV